MHDPRHARDRIRSDINIAPLVDVCLVLLIIFMVVTPMLGPKPVELPKGHHPGDQPDNTGVVKILLTFGPPPEIYIGDGREPLSLETLKNRVADLASVPGAIRLAIRADHRLPYREIKRVLGTLRDAGFKEAALIAERVTRGQR